MQRTITVGGIMTVRLVSSFRYTFGFSCSHTYKLELTFFLSLVKMVTSHTVMLPPTRDLGKFIVAKGLKKLPKVEKIAQSGYTAPNSQSSLFDANALVNYHPIQLDNA